MSVTVDKRKAVLEAACHVDEMRFLRKPLAEIKQYLDDYEMSHSLTLPKATKYMLLEECRRVYRDMRGVKE